MKTWLQGLLAALGVILLAGCVTVPRAPVEADTAAKSFVVKPGKANIYVYRNESLGGGVPMSVTLDGMMMGQSGPKTYFLFEVEPGRHVIQSIAENTTSVAFDTEAGKNYFAWQEVKMGLWMARSLLQIVDETTGRKGVAECKLVQLQQN